MKRKMKEKIYKLDRDEERRDEAEIQKRKYVDHMLYIT
jgi:hypothetical protein